MMAAERAAPASGAAAPSAPPSAAAAAFAAGLPGRGPIFVKLGHFLGGHPDLLEDAYIEPFVTLGDAAVPMPWAMVEVLLRDAWGGVAPEARLGSVSPTPRVARTLDQLHSATLLDGTPVTIRVLRPESRSLLLAAADPAAARQLGEILDVCCPSLSAAAKRKLLREFVAWLGDQLDLAAELARGERGGSDGSRARASGGGVVGGPALVPALCTPTVLVTAGGPPRALAVKAVGDGPGAARAIVRLFFDQVFLRYAVQADPVGANIALADGDGRRAEWISRTVCRDVPVAERRQIRALWSALHAGDEPATLRALRQSLEWSDGAGAVDADDTMRERFERLVVSELRRNVAARPQQNVPGAGRGFHAVDDMLLGILRAARETGAMLTPGSLSAHRMLIVGYRLARLVAAPEAVAPDETGRRLLAGLDWDDALDALEPEQLGKLAADLLLLVRGMPERLNQIAADLVDGSLGVTLVIEETPKTAQAWNRRIRLVALAVASLGPAFLIGQVGDASIAGIPLKVGLGVLLLLLYGWVALHWRRLK